MKYLGDWNKFDGHRFHANLGWQKEKDDGGGKGGIKSGSIIYHYVQSTTKLFNSITRPGETDAVALPILFMIKHGIELGMKHIILKVCTYHLYYIEEARGEDCKSRFKAKQETVLNKGHRLHALLALLNEDMLEFSSQMQMQYSFEISTSLQDVPIYDAGEYDEASNYELARKRVFPGGGISSINFFELMAEFVELFNKIDPFDSAFKYQTSKKGDATLGGVDNVNIELLVCYFVEISSVFSNFEDPLAGFFHDYEQWQDEFREYYGSE